MKKILISLPLFIFGMIMSNMADTASTNNLERTMCTMEFAPVCGEVAVQCIKAPCPPIQQTFSNKCQLGQNKLAKFLHEGECEENNNEVVDNYGYGTSKCIGGTNGEKCIKPITEIPITSPCLLSDNGSRRLCSDSMMRQQDRQKIENYVKENISKISNSFDIKEVLGGKFQTTKLSWVYEDHLNMLQVEYEDGHVSFTANIFAFTNIKSEITSDNKDGIKIDLFYLVKDNGKIVDKKSDDKYTMENYIKDNISKISNDNNIKETLGGKFFVVGEAEWINDNNVIVNYEDGHSAFTARITIHIEKSKNKEDTVKIDNFKVVDDKERNIAIKNDQNKQNIVKKQNIFSKIQNFFLNIFRGNRKNK